jgi:DNA repair exonuclease SbcCD ATPase subunit
LIKFREFGGKDVFQYENFNLKITPGKHLIIGKNLSEANANSNGSGKSSIPETLDWILFKKSSEGAGKDGMDISRNWKGGSSGSVKFFANEHNYEIDRYGKAKGKDKCLDNAVKLLEDGDDISQRLPTQVDDEIIKLIGMDYDIASMTITVLQGLPSNFSTLMPTVRKGYIENMVGFSVWDDIKKLLDKFLSAENVKIDDKTSKFQAEREKMINLNSRLQALKDAGKTQKDQIMADIKKIKADLFPVLTALEGIAKDRVEISKKFLGEQKTEELKKTKLFGMTILNESKSTISNLDSTIMSLSSRANDFRKILSTKICPTCKQNFPESTIKDAEESVIELDAKNERVKSTKPFFVEIRDKLEIIEREDTKLSTTKTMLENQILSLVSSLEKEDETGEISKLETALTALTDTVNLISVSMAEINKEIGYLTYLSDLLKPSSKFRSSTLEKYLKYINSDILGRICPIILDKIGVDLVISTDKRGSGVDLQITKDGKVIPYKSRSGGEKRRIDVALILAFQRFLLEIYSVSTNLLFFDEIMDPLDNRGVETVLNCIDILFPENMAIYIITHKEAFKDLFDDVITVVKQNDISKIEG